MSKISQSLRIDGLSLKLRILKNKNFVQCVELKIKLLQNFVKDVVKNKNDF